MNHKQLFTVAVALLGLLFNGAASIADDTNPDSVTDAGRIESAGMHRETAKKVTADAALQAVESVKAANKLDLDIRLLGPTIVKTANKR